MRRDDDDEKREVASDWNTLCRVVGYPLLVKKKYWRKVHKRREVAHIKCNDDADALVKIYIF